MFAISTNVLDGRSEIYDRQAELTDLYGRIEDGTAGASKLIITRNGLSLEELERNESPDGDRSAGDWQYVNLLLEQGLSEDEIDERFRASARMRDKWERDDYRVRTFAAARKNQATRNVTPSRPAAQLEGPAVEFNPWDYALNALPDHKFSGWFPRGRITVISGASGSMKTTFIAQALIAGRNGDRFLGHPGGGLEFAFLFADRGKWDAEETFQRMNIVGQVPYECINGL